MKAELRDRVIEEVEKLFVFAGEGSYDQGALHFADILANLQKSFDPMRTKEQLGAFLDQMPEPSWKERVLILGGFKYFPHLLHFGVKELAKIADDTLPAIPVGRPGLDLQSKAKIVAHVGQRHTSGYTLEQAKKSASVNFAVSEAAVQRAWDDRASIGNADFRFVVKFFSDGPDAE